MNGIYTNIIHGKIKKNLKFHYQYPKATFSCVYWDFFFLRFCLLFGKLNKRYVYTAEANDRVQNKFRVCSLAEIVWANGI